jgi:hypothetical protein
LNDIHKGDLITAALMRRKTTADATLKFILSFDFKVGATTCESGKCVFSRRSNLQNSNAINKPQRLNQKRQKMTKNAIRRGSRQDRH